MKTGVVPILMFVAAFVVTTAALIFLNTQFMNIFKFNFTPVNHAVVADSTGIKNDSTNVVKSDSAKALDSLKAIANDVSNFTDSPVAAPAKEEKKEDSKPEEKKPEPQKTPAETKQQSAPVNTPANSASNQADKVNNDIKNAEIKKMDQAAYNDWKKKTAGIIEAMDATRASQILRMYADNIGKDLLYSMKKKKAAEILSKFDAKKDSVIIRKLTRIQ